MTTQPTVDGSPLVQELESLRASMDTALATLDGELFHNLHRKRSGLIRQIPARIADPVLRTRLLERAAAENKAWIGLTREAGIEIKRQIEDLRTDRKTRQALSHAYGQRPTGSQLLSHPG